LTRKQLTISGGAKIAWHFDKKLKANDKEALRALLPGPWAEANKKLREQTQIPPAPSSPNPTPTDAPNPSPAPPPSPKATNTQLTTKTGEGK
jgi:hypothetical protein